MNTKLKGIIVCAVMVVGLGGTLALLKITGVDSTDSTADDSSSTSTTSSTADESVQLVDAESDDIEQISVTNEYGGYTFIGESETGKTSAGIKELEGLTLNSTSVSDLASDAAQLTAYKLVEEGATELDKYGLSEPVATFTLTFRDGTERTFEIGDVAPQNRYRYLKESDSTDVYMILTSTVSGYMDRKESFVSTTLLETPDDDDMPDYGKMTISRTDIDYDMVFEQDSEENENELSDSMLSSQVMTEPIFSYLNLSVSTDTTHGLYGLTAEEAEVAFPTDEDMKEYGLDEPMTTVTFTGDGYDYTLTVGNAYHETDEDGKEKTDVAAYYCYFKGVDYKDCIWKIDASALPWVTITPSDIITTLMTWNMIVDLDSVTITGDTTADFELTVEGEGDDEDVTAVTLDGEDVDVDIFKDYYQFIMTCPTDDLQFELPEGTPYMTLSLNRSDGDADVIEFYEDSTSDRRVIAVLNGKTPYRIQTNWVDRMLKNVEAVRNGEEVVDSF
jgi:hypothetical protein